MTATVKRVKTIKIGSTELLKEQNPKQTSSIRLNQWVLLLLRMLIVGLLAMIIAVPSIELLEKEKSITYLVEPSLLELEKVNSILDSIEEGEIRLLQTGFPLVLDTEKGVDQNETPNTLGKHGNRRCSFPNANRIYGFGQRRIRPDIAKLGHQLSRHRRRRVGQAPRLHL